MKYINDYIVNWLKDYATSSNMNGFVIGISGGIDSAVTSKLCAQTGLKTLCVEMPIHQDPNQVSRAKEHIKLLKSEFTNVESVEADLTSVFDTFTSNIQKGDDEKLYNLSLANTRARLRMTTLYYYAGVNKLLVAGTGNKVEDFGVGFYTKYGDGGVDLSPIADLMKSEVYELGRYLGVSENILNARPTDGLWTDGRTDEDQIGATYDELEWAMNFLDTGIIDYEKAPDVDRQKIVLDIYTKRNMANRHKMNPIPVCSLKKFRNYLNKLEVD